MNMKPKKASEAGKKRRKFPHGEDSIQRWAVVFRNGNPIAAFATSEMANGWCSEAPHRAKDTVSNRHITFKGIDGYIDSYGHEIPSH